MAQQNAEWVERIVETYSTMLLRIAMQQMKHKSDAEDVVQTVFLKLLRTKPVFKNEAHEKAWLIRVTINACHDEQRLAHRKRSAPLEEGLPAGEEHGEDSLAVMEAVAALGEKYSPIVQLYYYEGYATAEIAELLALNKNTVESRLFRAREKLRSTLKGGWD